MVVVLSTIGGFSLFIEPYVMTGGGPLNSTLSTVTIYVQAGILLLPHGLRRYTLDWSLHCLIFSWFFFNALLLKNKKMRKPSYILYSSSRLEPSCILSFG
jgi:ABC-type sugar transport system permease subunit